MTDIVTTHRRPEWVRLAPKVKDVVPGHTKAGPWAGWVLHHFARPDVPAGHTLEQEAAVMRNVDRYHAGQGWGGLGYGFVIFDSGRLWEARGWSRTGAHTVGQNSKLMGVCFAINGDAHMPSDAAWATAAGLIITGEGHGLVTPHSPIYGHHDFAKKSCPGKKVTAAKRRALRAWLDAL